MLAVRCRLTQSFIVKTEYNKEITELNIVAESMFGKVVIGRNGR